MNCKVEAEVVEILGRGECPFGHRRGDRWTFDGKMPGGICGSAAYVLFPLVQTLRFGATPSWSAEEGRARLCCPDPENPVVFELRRLEEPLG